MYGITTAGTMIVAVVEVVECHCGIMEDQLERGPNGRLKWEYDGNGADVQWDEMCPEVQSDGWIFVDEHGQHWHEREVTLTHLEAKQYQEDTTVTERLTTDQLEDIVHAFNMSLGVLLALAGFMDEGRADIVDTQLRMANTHARISEILYQRRKQENADG